MAKIPAQSLIEIFQTMLDEHWVYQLGAAEKGKVDCSGAFVYAYKQFNQSIYHGSNRIARVYVEELKPFDVKTTPNAKPGYVLFKTYEKGNSKYSLPDSYKQGGSQYNGDLKDYYHLGLVANDGVSVLNAQSASTGFVSSPITQNWSYVAKLKAVAYSERETPAESNAEETLRLIKYHLKELQKLVGE